MFYFQPRSLGEMIQFDEHIFQLAWFKHQRVNILPPPKKILGGHFGCSPCFVERNTALWFSCLSSFGGFVLGTANIVVVVCFLKRICFSRSLLSTKMYTPKLVEKVCLKSPGRLIFGILLLQKRAGRTSAVNACCDDLISAGYDWQFSRRHLGVVFSPWNSREFRCPKKKFEQVFKQCTSVGVREVF